MQITVSVLATREEIYEWISEQLNRFELYFALVGYFPFKLIPLGGEGFF
jgi:hypothetical protein